MDNNSNNDIDIDVNAENECDIIFDKQYYGDEYDNVDACTYERFRRHDNYIRSSTNRDYSPSNPWDAPGMSIKDFI